MVDETYGSPNTRLIALRYLDSDLLAASIERKLSREELKYATRRILVALSALHEKGYVHSDTYACFIRLQPGY
jgi:serine/threonine protein kinase